MEIALGLVRHLLTAGGGALVAAGYIDETGAQALVGAVLTILGVAWSAWAKKK